MSQSRFAPRECSLAGEVHDTAQMHGLSPARQRPLLARSDREVACLAARQEPLQQGRIKRAAAWITLCGIGGQDE